MTTPAYFNSVLRIVREAYTEAGRLEELQDPTPEQWARGKDRLADLVNLWITQGLKLWLMQDQSITLTSGTASYTLGPGGSIITNRPLRALQGYFLDSGNNRRPIYSISWDEWLRLPNTTQTGPITQFLVDKQLTNLVVTFWQTPDATAATGTAHLFIETLVTQPNVSLTDTLGFPTEWYLALIWGLADEFTTGQPESVIARCKEKALLYRTMLEGWDVEDASTSMAVDTTRWNQGITGRFR